jgi:phenylglyoxylate dehydrogenase epsilon subunit
MSSTQYLIVGSSHAGLSAIEAIRTQDEEGSITLLTQEEYLPYSPTILPYVVSGEVEPGKASLMDEAAIENWKIDFRKGAKVVGVKPGAHAVTLQSGEEIGFEKLLFATGAEPTFPSIPGIEEIPHHVLRTMNDAIELRRAAVGARSAIIVGAGLIGMHLAESLRKAGLQVSLVETITHVLPGYFDREAAGLIQRIFSQNDVHIFTGSPIIHMTASNGHCAVSLESGMDLSAELLIVATGVKSRTHYLSGSGIEFDEGVLVGDTMRTSKADIWAAGDVAQAKSFFGPSKKVHATLPTAVEQGRIAGMDMAGDSALKPYGGGLSMNTYRFFGHRSFSVGLTDALRSGEDIEVDQMFLPASQQYQKLVYRNDRLIGVSSINSVIDPGIMCQIIRRGVDLSSVRKSFSSSPLETGRLLMTEIWG